MGDVIPFRAKSRPPDRGSSCDFDLRDLADAVFDSAAAANWQQGMGAEFAAPAGLNAPDPRLAFYLGYEKARELKRELALMAPMMIGAGFGLPRLLAQSKARDEPPDVPCAD
jgi:hypothetical protein